MDETPREQRGRPPRLSEIHACYDPPIFFVTICVRDRRSLLATNTVHTAFRKFAEDGHSRFGVAVGRYVLMPDHLHLFVRLPRERRLDQWVRMLKRYLILNGELPSGCWQEGFFDHLLRHRESYSQKWSYVEQNPVRAGLVKSAADWPHQGEVVAIRY